MDNGGYEAELELDNSPSLPHGRQNESSRTRAMRLGNDRRYGGPTGPPNISAEVGYGGRHGPPIRRRNDWTMRLQPMVEVHPDDRSSSRQRTEGAFNIDQCDSRARQGRGGDCYPGTLTEQGQRLQTYINWPQQRTGQNPGDLADAGFFFTAYGDEVECQYCGLVLGTWDPSDVPMDEHRRYKPGCRFIRQFSA